ncbi:hypothetical protein [Neolewinella persica]|uniref:hypothetical protein n=1 Tax=Neolewinella persica TaxID=70998 RepID=UPI0012FC2561|nr:hypothetical protein [Neolewinella persica]
MKHVLSFCFFGLLILSCDKSQSPPDGLEVGQTFTVNDTRITFSQVENDSRCPCEADCIWEGVATVRLLAGSDTLRVYTTDNGGFSKTTTFEDKTIRLVSLLPEPCNGQPDSQDDYRLKIAVE